jgi:hypothetical protein
MRPAAPMKSLMTSISSLGEIQRCYTPDTRVPIVSFLDKPSLFAVAIYEAFCDHCPLKLNPNLVWLTILQGFATYMSRHAELLRSQFVSHAKKDLITVCRPDFTYDNPANDWESIFPQFADELHRRTKPGICELLESNFSNTLR